MNSTPTRSSLYGTIVIAFGCGSSTTPTPTGSTQMNSPTGGTDSSTAAPDSSSSTADSAVVETSFTSPAPDSGGGASDAAQSTDATTPQPADAATSDAAPSDAAPGLVAAKDLVCTQVMGVSITYDWFTHGFDAAPLDTTRWQFKGIDVAGMQFIDEWSNPTSTLWNSPVTMPCAKNSNNPDRIIFVGVNWVYTTAAQWVSAYNALFGTLKGKYSNLKRVDLMTMLRAPGNMLCPTNMNVELVVQPFIDQAIQTVVKSNPTFATAAPAFFAPDCSVFQPNSPHLVPASAPSVAKVFQDYYVKEP